MDNITLLTKHHKAAVLETALAESGFTLTTIDAFDTDQLGTFTGEQQRIKSQLNTALQKAQLGAQLGNTRYGLGSEGSFGPDPFIGMMPWNIEVLAWWDAQTEHAVYAMIQGPETNYSQKSVSSIDEAKQFLAQVKFPEHGIIIGTNNDSYFNKDVQTLEMALEILQPLLAVAPVWLETDMRAYRNPTRMRMIGKCALKLAHNLKCLCPMCTQRGFVASAQIPGAICESCGAETRYPRAELLSCSACGHKEERLLNSFAPANRCDFCNP